MRRLTGAFLCVALMSGCAIFTPAPPVETVVVTQEGTATTVGIGEFTVYYPAPFLSPPSLDVTPVDGNGMIMHLEQKEDRFVVTAFSTGMGQQGVALKWKARGPVSKSHASANTETPAATSATPVTAK